MVASILSCPKCSMLILEDTAICPGCHHVLKSDHAELAEQVIAQSERFDGSDEIACRECQAMNRRSLVRCWQCGAFMREDIERIFQEMQSRPSAIIDAHELHVEQNAPGDSGVMEASAFDDDDEDDFELSEDYSMFVAANDPDEIGTLAETTEFDLADGPLPMLHDPDAVADVDASASAKSANVESGLSKARRRPIEELDEEDELLRMAVREEREHNRQSAKRKRGAAKGTFLMKGPCGDCKIRVQNYHQGMMGQCPKCALPFMVPILAKPKAATAEKSAAGKTGAGEPLSPEHRIEAARWHEIVTKKFKPKPDLLAKQGETVDLFSRSEGLLIVWPEKKGLMGPNAKQTAQTRTAIIAHLQAGDPLEKLPATRHELISPELLAGARLIQPAPAEQEDFTGGVKLFATGTITIEIPSPAVSTELSDIEAQAAEAASTAAASAMKFAKKTPKAKKAKAPKPKAPVEPPIRCLTLTLSQYRRLRQWLVALLSTPDVLLLPELPLEDATETYRCQFSEQEFVALTGAEWYQADPATPTTTVGWQCQCGKIAISEQARVEHKFGGGKPAGLAKAKCPGCEQNFGQQPLVHLTSVVAPPPPVPETTADDKQPAAATADEPRATAPPADTPATPNTDPAATTAESTPAPAEVTDTSENKEKPKSRFGMFSRGKK